MKNLIQYKSFKKLFEKIKNKYWNEKIGDGFKGDRLLCYQLVGKSKFSTILTLLPNGIKIKSTIYNKFVLFTKKSNIRFLKEKKKIYLNFDDNLKYNHLYYLYDGTENSDGGDGNGEFNETYNREGNISKENNMYQKIIKNKFSTMNQLFDSRAYDNKKTKSHNEINWFIKEFEYLKILFLTNSFGLPFFCYDVKFRSVTENFQKGQIFLTPRGISFYKNNDVTNWIDLRNVSHRLEIDNNSNQNSSKGLKNNFAENLEVLLLKYQPNTKIPSKVFDNIKNSNRSSGNYIDSIDDDSDSVTINSNTNTGGRTRNANIFDCSANDFDKDENTINQQKRESKIFVQFINSESIKVFVSTFEKFFSRSNSTRKITHFFVFLFDKNNRQVCNAEINLNGLNFELKSQKKNITIDHFEKCIKFHKPSKEPKKLYIVCKENKFYIQFISAAMRDIFYFNYNRQRNHIIGSSTFPIKNQHNKRTTVKLFSNGMSLKTNDGTFIFYPFNSQYKYSLDYYKATIIKINLNSNPIPLSTNNLLKFSFNFQFAFKSNVDRNLFIETFNNYTQPNNSLDSMHLQQKRQIHAFLTGGAFNAYVEDSVNFENIKSDAFIECLIMDKNSLLQISTKYSSGLIKPRNVLPILTLQTCKYQIQQNPNRPWVLTIFKNNSEKTKTKNKNKNKNKNKKKKKILEKKLILALKNETKVKEFIEKFKSMVN